MKVPLHPKANHYLRLGLFSEVQSFEDIENRIENLATAKERGDAFEVFVEACLATQRIHQAKEVWPESTMPRETRERLRLPSTDKGVDGVYLTSDKIVCYQAKFRSARKHITFTELSTFYSLADGGDQKLVFTNSDKIGGTATDRIGAIFVRGTDLERLNRDDFREIETWLQGAKIETRKKEPLPHQEEALSDILSGLSKQSRTTALMACASGKTLVALWTAEKLDAKTILVLLPSLALVRQTLYEWMHETSFSDVDHLCVCSDETVKLEEDSLIVRPSELSTTEVTTNHSELRQFLEKPTSATKIVFSTYQSSQVVSEASIGLPPFDFGVFDEAHKTAGRANKKNGLALSDENIAIKRRLFLTATPKHYEVGKKDRYGDSKTVFSMDDQVIYGSVCHQLTFRDAAKAGIITDYKVIISIVTSEMVTNEAIRRGIVNIKGDEVKARQVAHQIALISAIKKYNASKVFTFHTKVSAAKSFTSKESAGIATHIEGFNTTHVEGKMPTSAREQIMKEFAKHPKAILSNARCLTEGVDVPAVDMVAFMSPKRSLVDIVQATGRALRKSDETNKKVGYVLVPIYVEQERGESIQEAVLRSNFDEVWRVLQAMKEQDELLAQSVKEMQVERGKTGGFDDSRFRPIVDILGPEISLETLRRTITAACIDAIGEGWFEKLGQLSAYFDKHGNSNIPARWKENKKLATWVVNQREKKRNNQLEEDKIKLLNRFEFNWNPYDTDWRATYIRLQKYKAEHGNCNVPSTWHQDKKLATWVSTQRSDYAANKMPMERVMLLNNLGFEWLISNGISWHARFSQLQEFKTRFGHTKVNVKWPENPQLGGWVVKQRYDYRRGKLKQEYVDRLNSINFAWSGKSDKNARKNPDSPEGQKWTEEFNRLKEYAKHKPIDIIKVIDEETEELNRWVKRQRSFRRKNGLSLSQIEALNEIGFTWKYLAIVGSNKTPKTREPLATWEQMYEGVAEFYKRQGHCNIPDNWSANPSLPLWVQDLKELKHQSKLSQQQLDQLEAIGFRWTSYERKWDEMFFKLIAQMRPKHSGKARESNYSPALKRWILTQRQLKKKGQLSSDREEKLSSIGFTWDYYDALWEEMRERLISYKEKHGDCLVPAQWEDPTLGSWVLTQRMNRKKNRLSESRIEKLDALGFSWTLNTSNQNFSSWDDMFEELLSYIDTNGHCELLDSWTSPLASWLRTQRRLKRQNKLSEEEISKLEAVGFQWSTHDAGWEKMFTRLIEWQENKTCADAPQELRSWMTTQRQFYKQNKLNPERIQKLESIQFDWDPMNSKWEEMLSKLKTYREKHGNCLVPNKWSNDPELANWVRTQKSFKRAHRLSESRRKKLASIQFEWQTARAKVKKSPSKAPKADWYAMLEELRVYRAECGNCLVPQKWVENKPLADWVSWQRVACKRGLLEQDQVEALDHLSFDWDPMNTHWENMFSQLVEYKEKHGHCNVPQRSDDYPDLATWVRTQRIAMREKRASLLGNRKERLEELGFTWAVYEKEPWDEMLEKLKTYKSKYGDCNVPQKWKENRKLGRWVNTQRLRRLQGKIKPERVRRLNSIGFVWNTKGGKMDEQGELEF